MYICVVGIYVSCVGIWVVGNYVSCIMIIMVSCDNGGLYLCIV